MVCAFLRNLSLASLVAPVAEEDFRSQYWERQPLIVHRKQPGYYDGLFNIRGFRGIHQPLTGLR